MAQQLGAVPTRPIDAGEPGVFELVGPEGPLAKVFYRPVATCIATPRDTANERDKLRTLVRSPVT